jgi:hypothetical protein
MMMLSALACAPAGVIGGKLFDLSGSYTPTFLLNLMLCGAGLIALCFARMPQPPQRVVEAVPALAG